jgi:biopolymer transport protein ExbD
MSRFRKNEKKETPEITTSSMSDIVFMFLFFFMVITNMRESETKVKFKPPHASEYQKLEKKAAVATIYMGEPINSEAAAKAIDGKIAVQLNDKIANPVPIDFASDIKSFIKAERDDRIQKQEDPNIITYSLKIDGDVQMMYVTTLKEELRNNNALKINYATKKEKK